jgi:hypothetical protein
MAGSYQHVTQEINGKRQFVGCTLLDHMGDGYGAIEELWFMAHYLAGDDPKKLDEALERYQKPSDDPVANELKNRISEAVDNDWWEDHLE